MGLGFWVLGLGLVGGFTRMMEKEHGNYCIAFRV